MPYRFAKERRDYTDYASGRVFYNLPGAPAFPVRLTGEIFQRCAAELLDRGRAGPYVLYDPCCGAAYHLATLGYLHGGAIDAILASDVDDAALAVAARNLSLLTVAGLVRREAELAEMLDAYGKASHAAALRSAAHLRRRLEDLPAAPSIRTRVFAADAMDSQAMRAGLGGVEVDIVLTDVPYGEHAAWYLDGVAQASAWSPVGQMLAALRPVIAAHTVVAIASDKGQKARHGRYRRLDRFQIGKRRIVLLQKKEAG
jgi:hypothetical protein